jgi:hypothetical protein
LARWKDEKICGIELLPHRVAGRQMTEKMNHLSHTHLSGSLLQLGSMLSISDDCQVNLDAAVYRNPNCLKQDIRRLVELGKRADEDAPNRACHGIMVAGA